MVDKTKPDDDKIIIRQESPAPDGRHAAPLTGRWSLGKVSVEKNSLEVEIHNIL